MKTANLINRVPETTYKLLKYIIVDEDDYESYAEKLRQEIEILALKEEFNINEYFEKCAKLIVLNPPNVHLSMLYDLLATLYVKKNDLKSAISSLEMAIKYSIIEDNYDNMVKSTTNLAVIYIKTELYDKAKELLLDEINLYEEKTDVKIFSPVYICLGDVYKHSNETQKAINCYDKAIEIANSSYDNINLLSALSKLGELYKDNNDHIKAKDIYYKAYDLALKTNAKKQVILIAEVLCELHMYNYNYGSAISIINKIKKHMLDKQETVDNINIYYQAAKIYEFFEDSTNALEMYNIFASQMDRLKRQQIKLFEELADTKKNIIDKYISKKKSNPTKQKSHNNTEGNDRLYQDIATINEIFTDITKESTIEHIIKTLYRHISSLMPLDCLVLFTVDKDASILTAYVKEDSDENSTTTFNLSIGDENSIAAYSARTRKEIFTNDYRNDIFKYKQEFKNESNETGIIKSVIMLPLFINDKLIGGFSAQCIRKNAFSKSDYKTLVSISSYLAVTINSVSKSEKLNRDIETRKQCENKLIEVNKDIKEISSIDQISKLPNRRKFMNILKRELFTNQNIDSVLSLVVISIDNLKEYTENYGYIKGDSCIYNVATVLNEHLTNQGHFFCRYGDNEFIAIVKDSKISKTKIICEHLQKLVCDLDIKNKYSNESDYITISIGAIGIKLNKNTEIINIIQHAGKCLKKAKEKGDNSLYISFDYDIDK